MSLYLSSLLLEGLQRIEDLNKVIFVSFPVINCWCFAESRSWSGCNSMCSSYEYLVGLSEYLCTPEVSRHRAQSLRVSGLQSFSYVVAIPDEPAC